MLVKLYIQASMKAPDAPVPQNWGGEVMEDTACWILSYVCKQKDPKASQEVLCVPGWSIHSFPYSVPDERLSFQLWRIYRLKSGRPACKWYSFGLPSSTLIKSPSFNRVAASGEGIWAWTACLSLLVWKGYFNMCWNYSSPTATLNEMARRLQTEEHQ